MSEQYGYDVSEQAQNVKYKYAASPGGQNGTTFVLMWSWVNLPTLPATSSSRVHVKSFSGLSPYQFERSSSDKQIPNSLIMQFTSTDYWCSSGIENARVARILKRPKLSKDEIFLKILWCHSHHLNNIIKLSKSKTYLATIIHLHLYQLWPQNMCSIACFNFHRKTATIILHLRCRRSEFIQFLNI